MPRPCFGIVIKGQKHLKKAWDISLVWRLSDLGFSTQNLGPWEGFEKETLLQMILLIVTEIWKKNTGESIGKKSRNLFSLIVEHLGRFVWEVLRSYEWHVKITWRKMFSDQSFVNQGFHSKADLRTASEAAKGKLIQFLRSCKSFLHFFWVQSHPFDLQCLFGLVYPGGLHGPSKVNIPRGK